MLVRVITILLLITILLALLALLLRLLICERQNLLTATVCKQPMMMRAAWVLDFCVE